MGRSILAVLGGLITIFILISLGIYIHGLISPESYGMDATTVPTVEDMIINLIYSGFFAGVGGYVTAAIAKGSPMRHALYLVGANLIMWLTMILMPNPGEVEQPAWYMGALPIIMLISVLTGAAFRARQHPADRVAA